MREDATPALAPGRAGDDKSPHESHTPQHKKPRFVEADPPRPAPLGRVRTDDEALLAAEIEKLR